MTIDERTNWLRSLLSLEVPLDAVLVALQRFPWDSDELVTLTPEHMSRVLRRFLAGAVVLSARRRPIGYFFAAACFSRNSLIICSCVARGTGWYFANSIEYSPLPCVAERRSVEYPNISDSGTCALAIR